MMLVNALEVLKKLNKEPRFNIDDIDFQEEMGSPTVVSAVSLYARKT